MSSLMFSSFRVWLRSTKRVWFRLFFGGTFKGTQLSFQRHQNLRLRKNFQVFDFKLTKEDMDLIKTIDRKYRTNQPGKYWGIDVYA